MIFKNCFKTVPLGLSLLSIPACERYPKWDHFNNLPEAKESTLTSKNLRVAEWQTLDRYQVKGELAKDPRTGLMWMRCGLGQDWNGYTCIGTAAEYTWDNAMSIPNDFKYAGYSDWRIPTLEELNSLMYCSSGWAKLIIEGRSHCVGNFFRPTIAKAVFPETAFVYWSSSSPTSNGKFALAVDFVYGYEFESLKDFDLRVRLVRSAQ